MGELGFLGLSYPEEYGGQGGDYFCNLVLAEEIRGPTPAARNGSHRAYGHGHAADLPLRKRREAPRDARLGRRPAGGGLGPFERT